MGDVFSNASLSFNLLKTLLDHIAENIKYLFFSLHISKKLYHIRYLFSQLLLDSRFLLLLLFHRIENRLRFLFRPKIAVILTGFRYPLFEHQTILHDTRMPLKILVPVNRAGNFHRYKKSDDSHRQYTQRCDQYRHSADRFHPSRKQAP